MPHSHLLVHHLIRQAERRRRPTIPPVRLKRFIQAAAECFEPLQGCACVGWTGEKQAGIWQLRLYLCDAHPQEGRAWKTPSFALNVTRFISLFSRVDEIQWYVSTSKPTGDAAFLVIRGCVERYPLICKAYSRCPVSDFIPIDNGADADPC